MRDLYEEIIEHYILQEGLSKAPTTPIETDADNNRLSTKLTTYEHGSNILPPHKYHKEFSGIEHGVSWENNHKPENLSNIDKKNSLHDAAHLHNHFIKHNTEVGDVVSNMPIADKDDKTKNKRSRIYKAHGFGGLGDDGAQYGIVKQHPDDHPDEHKRGQKFLHPLEHEEIAAHGDAPSAGASDNKVRHISSNGNHTTKLNNTMHGTYKNDDGTTEYQSDVAMDHENNERDMKLGRKHHEEYIKSKTPSKTPTIDRLMSKKRQ